MLVVATIGAWMSAKVQLGDTQDRLDATQADLEAHRDWLAYAEARKAETQASITRVQGAIDIAMADRAQLETMIADLQSQIAAVDARAHRPPTPRAPSTPARPTPGPASTGCRRPWTPTAATTTRHP